MLVAVTGGPWGIDEAVLINLTFRDDAAPFARANPFGITTVSLLDTDGVGVLATVQGDALNHPGVGEYRASFPQQEAAGEYWIRVVFVPEDGAPAATAIEPLVIENIAASVVAGVMSVETLLCDFLGEIADDDPFSLLMAEDPNNPGTLIRVVSDKTIAGILSNEAKALEMALHTSFTTTRYACRPNVTSPGGTALVQGIDYDDEVDPVDAHWPHSGATMGILRFAHPNVRRVTRARLMFGHTVLYGVPTRWLNLDMRQGSARVIVDSGTLRDNEAGITYATTFGHLANYWSNYASHWPMLWAIDYEAGLPKIPGSVRQLLGWRVVAQVLALAARRSNPHAIQNQSAAKDGLSRSMSVSDTGPGGRFNALLSAPVIAEWVAPEKVREVKFQLRPGVAVY